MRKHIFCRSKLSSSITAAIGATVILGSTFASMASAQELEEIQITGSRISRSTMETPTPVTTVNASELAAMAPGNLIDGMAQMPQFSANLTPDSVNGGQNAGGSNVNMRGAGTNRTLTLLNGRRFVPSNRFGTVDVALFPEDLVKSVETVTGGASASYGTDAVAGVVNFLLDTDYEGIKTHFQAGSTERRDGENYEMSISGGHEFDNGIHVLGSFSRYRISAIDTREALEKRDYIKNYARVTNPDANGPTEVILPWVRPTNFSGTGVLYDDRTFGRKEFNTDGTFTTLPFNGQGVLTTGCQCFSDVANGYGVNADPNLNSGYKRDTGFLFADYDLGADTNVYAQYVWGENRASDRRESISLLSGWVGRIYAENAFLRPEVKQLLADNKLNFASYGFFPPNIPSTPLGESVQDTLNTVDQYTLGLKHDFSIGFLQDWTLDAYIQKGENIQDFITINGVRVDRMPIALDAVADPVTGQPICRVNLPQYTVPVSQGGNGGVFADCRPINTFGGVQNISKQAADWIMDRDDKIARQWTEQFFWEAVISGEVFEGFGAGAVDAAFGASYRKETFDQRTLDPSNEFPALPDGRLLSDLGLMPAGVRGLLTDTAGGPAGVRFVPAGYQGDANSSSVLFSSMRAFGGEYDVTEAFTEFNIPLISGMNLVENLETSLAARWADYSGSGEIWAWKAGLNWTINDEFRVRATSSRDVRAATLRERYDQTRGGINVRNPWANDLVFSAASLSGGNPNVNPEKADTITAGVVYQPQWLDGLSVSVDWYNMDVNGALAQLSAQNIVDGCRGGDLSLCQYVITPNGAVTNPTSNDPRQIDRVESLFINLQNQTINGIDVEMRYSTDLSLLGGDESLSWRFLYSWLGENSIQTPGGVKDDRAGSNGFYENKVTTSLTYRKDNYNAFLQARWIDGAVLDRTRVESSTKVPASARGNNLILALCNGGTTVCSINDNTMPSITYVDARFAASYGEDENLEVFMNVNNMLDRDPVLSPGTIGRTGVGVGVGGAYDILGRNYTIGMNYAF
jgi:iron complex outermembrane receptor protein